MEDFRANSIEYLSLVIIVIIVNHFCDFCQGTVMAAKTYPFLMAKFGFHFVSVIFKCGLGTLALVCSFQKWS